MIILSLYYPTFPLAHILHVEFVWGGNLIAKQDREHISICKSCQCRWAVGIQYPTKGAVHPAMHLIIWVVDLRVHMRYGYYWKSLHILVVYQSSNQKEVAFAYQDLNHTWTDYLKMKNLQRHQKSVWKKIRIFRHPLLLDKVSVSIRKAHRSYLSMLRTPWLLRSVSDYC